jgi:hypothetical protein
MKEIEQRYIDEELDVAGVDVIAKIGERRGFRSVLKYLPEDDK